MKNKIKSLQEFVDTVNSRANQKRNFELTTHFWFRGQANCSWDLTPSIFRNEGSSFFEREMTRDFQLNSSQHLPMRPNNYIEWLFLMQHHKMPTRLLDWSESYLIALYFSVLDFKSDCDAAVWLLDPWSMNKFIVRDITVPTISHPVFENYLLKDNYHDDGDFQRQPTAELPIALRPHRNSSRIIAQKGTFTLHGHNPNGLNKIFKYDCENNLHFKQKLGNGKRNVKSGSVYLKKIVIDSGAKLKILRELFLAGITHSILFPELDGISKEISFRYSRQYHGAVDGHDHFGF